ncbi:hypothetical protein ACKKBG_A14385 [Auxenochlorella protothecoides x Auxenochlorella symbiontica]
MSEVLEGSLIKVPYETLKRTTRERKYVLDDIYKILAALPTLAEGTDGAQKLQDMASALQHLKTKLEGIAEAERGDLSRLLARVRYLRRVGQPEAGRLIDWNRPRINRLVIDYLLRRGYRQSALHLIQTSGPGSEEVADGHIFQPIQSVIAGLEQHRCTEALAWCRVHEARLAKARSSLVFRLRKQEFIELVRGGDTHAAIRYARRHLAPWAATQMGEMQAAAATLAFPGDARARRGTGLFADSQWQELVEALKQEVYRLYSLPPISPLTIHLQAGLAALNAPLHIQRSRADPLHLATYAGLAEGLPRAKHSHSHLICAISHVPMDEHNPPLVMKNGHVYGQAALRAQADRDDGVVTCPVTGYRCKYSELKRAYIS